MSFARSLLLLVTVSAAVTFPIFFGYGLSEQSFMWMGLGFGFLGFAAALAYVQAKVWISRDDDHRHDAHPHH